VRAEVHEAETDAGERPGLTTQEKEELTPIASSSNRIKPKQALAGARGMLLMRRLTTCIEGYRLHSAVSDLCQTVGELTEPPVHRLVDGEPACRRESAMCASGAAPRDVEGPDLLIL
jgi:hypothetical protein